MNALALPPASDRAAIDRHLVDRVGAERVERAGFERARSARIEILGPSWDDARAGARRYEEAANRTAAFAAWRDEARFQRRAPEPAMSMRFVAQFVAQQQPGNSAHVENWRGARAAYASADALGAGRGTSLSILI